MIIKLTKGWKRFPEGHVFDAPDGVANVLIKRGFAKEQAEGTDSREVAMAVGGTERAVDRKPKRRRVG